MLGFLAFLDFLLSDAFRGQASCFPPFSESLGDGDDCLVKPPEHKHIVKKHSQYYRPNNLKLGVGEIGERNELIGSELAQRKSDMAARMNPSDG